MAPPENSGYSGSGFCAPQKIAGVVLKCASSENSGYLGERLLRCYFLRAGVVLKLLPQKIAVIWGAAFVLKCASSENSGYLGERLLR